MSDVAGGEAVVIDFSKGGQVALYTALEPFRRAIVEDDRRFAAHVALYPYCNDWYTAERITRAPMVLLLGGRDDYTPAEPCRGYAEWFKSAGSETTVIVYPDAYHDFDSYRPPKLERALVTGRGCQMAVDLDHFAVKLRTTGEDITASGDRYARECLARGHRCRRRGGAAPGAGRRRRVPTPRARAVTASRWPFDGPRVLFRFCISLERRRLEIEAAPNRGWAPKGGRAQVGRTPARP